MPAIVSPRKTSSDSSRRGAVTAAVLPASIVLCLIVVSVIVVSVEVAIFVSSVSLSIFSGPLEWCVNHNTDSGDADGRKSVYQVLSAGLARRSLDGAAQAEFGTKSELKRKQ